MTSQDTETRAPTRHATEGDPADTAAAADRLRRAFDAMFGFVGILTPDGRLLDVNRRALRVFGVRAADAVGRLLWATPWWASADEADRTRLEQSVARAAAGERVRYDTDIVAPDGRRFRIDFTLSPVRDAAGRVDGIVAEGRDMTAAKAVEDELRLSEAKFAGIIGIASDAIITIDEDQRIVMFNRGAETVFGYAAEDVIGRPLDLLLPTRFRAAHRGHVRAFGESPVVARRMAERQEISGLRRSGEEFPAEASISKIDVGGRRLYTVVLRDATARRRIERAQRFLAVAGARLAGSLDPERIARTVAELGVEYLADCCVVYDATREHGIRSIELAGAEPAWTPLLDTLRGGRLDPREPHPVTAVLETGAAELIEDLVATELPHTESMRLFREIGVRSAIVTPLLARDRTVGAIGFYATRADRRYGEDELALAAELSTRAALAIDNARLYAAAQDAVRARDDMLAIVSHDLGNPLSAIRIGTSLLLRSVPPEQRIEGGWSHLEGIRQSAEQMERLVNDLLDVKRLETGQLTVRPTRERVGPLLAEVADVFAPLAESRRLQLIVRPPEDAAVVSCDRERTMQVFSNLIGNAIKFTAAGGTVEIEAAADGRAIRFTVRDTGAGIPEAQLGHVFDRFWKGHREPGGGLGLGLAIARGIVEAHDGRIWVESRPGVGSAFHFTLPADGADDA